MTKSTTQDSFFTASFGHSSNPTTDESRDSRLDMRMREQTLEDARYEAKWQADVAKGIVR